MVKRKRSVRPDAASDVGREPAAEETARAPRVFRVDSPAQVESRPVSDAPAVQSPRKRRRRALHGAVTTIRLTIQEAHRNEASDDSLAFQDFGVNGENRRRYAMLMKEIARLERQAVAAKKAEAAIAVRWIRKAILEYQIAPDDLGL